MRPAEYAPWLSVVVVIVGWMVVNHQSNRREDRKEARAVVDDVRDRLQSLVSEAISYFVDGKPVAPTIKAELEFIEMDLERFEAFHAPDGALMQRFITLSEAITGGDFESSTAPTVEANSPVVRSILAARNFLIFELEGAYRAQFADPWRSTLQRLWARLLTR